MRIFLDALCLRNTMINPNSVLGFVQKNPNYSTFAQILKISGLESIYNDPQLNSTVFVPSDKHLKNNVNIHGMDQGTAAGIVKFSTLNRVIDSKLIKDVRGSGLWIGVEMNPKHASARQVCEKMMQKGILSKETHETVVRFAPPLIIKKPAIDKAIKALRESLEEIEGKCSK